MRVFDKLSSRFRRKVEQESLVFKGESSPWHPNTQVPPETTRERFLRERRHRRRAANRTRNAVAKQARKVNRGSYSGR